MKLPNAGPTLVEREKIAEYLLIPAHPDNVGKEQFFMASGFQRNDWQALAATLVKLALMPSVAKRQAL